MILLRVSGEIEYFQNTETQFFSWDKEMYKGERKADNNQTKL